MGKRVDKAVSCKAYWILVREGWDSLDQLNWLLTHSLRKLLRGLQVSRKTQRDTFMAFRPTRKALLKSLNASNGWGHCQHKPFLRFPLDMDRESMYLHYARKVRTHLLCFTSNLGKDYKSLHNMGDTLQITIMFRNLNQRKNIKLSKFHLNRKSPFPL